MLGAVDPEGLGEAVIADDAAFDEGSEGEQVSAASVAGEGAADDGNDEVADLEVGDTVPPGLDPGQAFVAKNQVLCARRHPGFGRFQNFAIGSADS